MNARPVPTSAMARPGGMNHHHARASSAPLTWAQYSIVPQDHWVTLLRPRKAMLASVRIAPTTEARNVAVMMASSFGRMSNSMILSELSPVALAASTKSRLRSESVCARSTRAPQAQPVTVITMMMPVDPEFGRYEARMTTSGRLGMTRNTFENMDSSSLPVPDMYPPVRPTITDHSVVRMPAPNPTSMEMRAP